MAKSASLSLILGTYAIHVEAKQRYLKVPKVIVRNGENVTVDKFIPMESITIMLANDKGGLVTYRVTNMGKRTSVTRQTDLPPELVRNQQATGPALVERGEKPQPISLDGAIATIGRMCKVDSARIVQLFTFDSVAEHGTLVVTAEQEA